MNKWLDTIRSFQPDFQTTTHTKICSLYFLETDYNLSVVNNQKFLKKSAIPSVFTKCKVFLYFISLLFSYSQLEIISIIKIKRK